MAVCRSRDLHRSTWKYGNKRQFANLNNHNNATLFSAPVHDDYDYNRYCGVSVYDDRNLVFLH
jgi:hypothetical protein